MAAASQYPCSNQIRVLFCQHNTAHSDAVMMQATVECQSQDATMPHVRSGTGARKVAKRPSDPSNPPRLSDCPFPLCSRSSRIVIHLHSDLRSREHAHQAGLQLATYRINHGDRLGACDTASCTCRGGSILDYEVPPCPSPRNVNDRSPTPQMH